MRINTINTLNMHNERVTRHSVEEYKGYIVVKYSFYSHEYDHVFKDGKFIAQLSQDDEYNIEFNKAVQEYINLVDAVGAVLMPEKAIH